MRVHLGRIYCLFGLLIWLGLGGRVEILCRLRKPFQRRLEEGWWKGRRLTTFLRGGVELQEGRSLPFSLFPIVVDGKMIGYGQEGFGFKSTVTLI